MKRFFTVVLFLCVLLVAAVVVVPSFIDWNAYRGDLSVLLSRTAGRQVSIDGNLEMAFLPSPHLNARDVRIANIEGAADADLARVGEIRMQIAASPLFGGRVSVTSLLLVEPVINLEIMPDGRTNWDTAAGSGRPSPGGKDGTRRPLALPLDLSFDRVAIAGGTLVWRRASGQPLRLERLNTQVAMADLAGPLKLEASASYGDLPFTASLFIGQRDSGKPVLVNARIALSDDVCQISLSGTVDGESQNFEGKIGMSGADAAALAAALAGKPVSGPPSWEFALESPITATPEEIDASEISVRLGRLDASGRAILALGEIPALTAKLDVATVNIDDILAQAGDTRSDLENGRVDAGEPATIPKAFDAEIDIRAGILRWKGSIVRDAGLTAKLKSGVLTVERAGAEFPGGTTVNLSGEVVEADGGPRLDGDLAAISDNLRAALLWSGMEESSLPADRLRAFSYTSRIAILPDTVNLTDIKARLDATGVSGAAVIARRKRPSFGVNLVFDQVGLDGYLADRDTAAPVPPNDTGEEAGTTVLGAFDANLNLTIGNLAWRDKSATQVRIDAQLFKGDLALRKLMVDDLGGAALTMSGTLNDLVGEPEAVLDVALEGRDPEAFAGFLGLKNMAIVQRVGKFMVAGQATGALGSTRIDAVLDAIGGKVSASGVVTGLDDRPALDLAMSVSHADSDRVLALLMPDRRAGGAGPLEAGFRLSGDADALALQDISGRLGETEYSGGIDVVLSGERPNITADLTTGVVFLDRLFPSMPEAGDGAVTPPVRGNARWSREPVDLAGLRDFDLRLSLRSSALVRRDIRVDEAGMQTTVEGGIVTVDAFSGKVFGGDMTVTGRLDATAPVSVMDGVISARDISSRQALESTTEFARLDGPVSTKFDLSATGRNEFELMSSLAGNGRITGNVEARLKDDERAQAGVGTLLGVLFGDKVKEVGATGDAIGALIKAFAVEPSALSGDFVVRNGVVRTDNLLLEGTGARALTTGTADLANWWIDSNTGMHRIEDRDEPYVTIGLKGPLDGPDIRTGGTWLKRPPEAAPRPPAIPPELAPETPPEPEEFIRDILKSIQ